MVIIFSINLSKLQRKIIDLDIKDPSDLAKYFGGLEVLGIGSTRIGIALGKDRVAKIAWKPPGLFHNQFEFRLWHYAKLIEKRHLFVPSLEFGPDKPLIQARCLPTKFEATETFKKVISELSEVGIVDTAVNLGIYEERIVCYDYSVPSSDLFFRVEQYIKPNFSK